MEILVETYPCDAMKQFLSGVNQMWQKGIEVPGKTNEKWKRKWYSIQPSERQFLGKMKWKNHRIHAE